MTSTNKTPISVWDQPVLLYGPFETWHRSDIPAWKYPGAFSLDGEYCHGVVSDWTGVDRSVDQTFLDKPHYYVRYKRAGRSADGVPTYRGIDWTPITRLPQGSTRIWRFDIVIDDSHESAVVVRSLGTHPTLTVDLTKFCRMRRVMVETPWNAPAPCEVSWNVITPDGAAFREEVSVDNAVPEAERDPANPAELRKLNVTFRHDGTHRNGLPVFTAVEWEPVRFAVFEVAQDMEQANVLHIISPDSGRGSSH